MYSFLRWFVLLIWGLLVVLIVTGLYPVGDFLRIGLPTILAVLVALLLVPYLTVALLAAVRLQRLAARYAGWTARRFPIAAQRRVCAMQAANLYVQLGDAARAEQFADQGIQMSEPYLDRPLLRVTYALCINAKGIIALHAGRYHDAWEDFYRPLRMHLEHPLYVPLFYSNCAAAVYGLGEFEKAIEYTANALAVATPKQSLVALLAHHNAALALAELGHFTKALAETSAATALKAPPTYRTMAALLHARMLWLNGQTAESDAAFAGAAPGVAKAGKVLHQRFHHLRGMTRYEQGRQDEAEADLRLALEGDSVAPAALYYLALIADKRGKGQEAMEWRERLRREVPESFYAQRIKGKIDGVV